MRKPVLWTMVVIGLMGLACGGSSSETKTPEGAAVTTTDGLWQLAEQEGQDFVKAGTGQGLAVGSRVALVGAPLVGTENRQVVGTATVAEVWPDLARLSRDSTPQGTPEAVGARLLQPEDEKGIQAMAAVEKRPAQRPDARPGDAPTDAPVQGPPNLPPGLSGGSSDSRIDALGRYEDDPGMTGPIVWVMKNDPDDDVRFKAWRVVRARWKKGTASTADSEAATVWQAANGSTDGRVEALALLADKSDSLKLPGRFLADRSQTVRIAAADAVFDMGRRTGQKKAAQDVLQGRLAVEDVPAVKKRLADLIGDL